MRVRKLMLLVGSVVLLDRPIAAAADGGDNDAEISSESAAVETETAVLGNGTTMVGGGYAGSDGVMSCSWYSVGDRYGSTHESYSEMDLAAMKVGATYYFQCFDLATGSRIENGWRIYDPPAGNPVVDLTMVATQYAQTALDNTPLPPPQLHTAPPVGSDSVVNLSTWVWVTNPQQMSASTEVNAQNNSVVTATAKRLVIDPGDGSEPFECPITATPWQPGADDGDPNSCQYAFGRSGQYRVTATLEWSTSFTSMVAGQPITGTVGDRRTTTVIDINVVEVVTHIR